MKRFKYTPDPVPNLLANEVFVFGANAQGSHGGGSARAATLNYGAVMGEVHRTGRCYGIITVEYVPNGEGTTLQKISPQDLHLEFGEFFSQVELESEKQFLLTKVGLGIAGWTIEEVKEIFWSHYDSDIHKNVTYPIEFEK